MNKQYKASMSGDEFRSWPNKAITLLGMSGVGKTTLGKRLPPESWFHYSGDYRIGTRYMNESILDNIKYEAMKVPFLAELLRSDSIYICHNITTENLSPISSFLGKIGSPMYGGIPVEEFKRRQALHMDAELCAMYDVDCFMDKAKNIYGYSQFINDAGGSLCELDDPKLFSMLATRTLIVYLRASDAMVDELVQRALASPKPLYYKPEFLDKNLETYLAEKGIDSADNIIPNDFYRWIFPRLVEYRIPRYEQIATTYGVAIDADQLQHLNNESEVLELIADSLDKQESSCR